MRSHNLVLRKRVLFLTALTFTLLLFTIQFVVFTDLTSAWHTSVSSVYKPQKRRQTRRPVGAVFMFCPLSLFISFRLCDIGRWQGSSFRFFLDYSLMIFSWPFLFYPGNSSIQEIEINGLKKCALDLLFMWSMHPPACFGQSIQNTDQKWGRSSMPFWFHSNIW